MKSPLKILEIYLKKSSININEKFLFSEKPNMKVDIRLNDLDFYSPKDNHFISNLGIFLSGTIDGENVFDLNVEYTLHSTIEGLSNDDIFRLQHTNIANYLFPFIRSECNRLLADTSLPKFQVQPIDFTALYISKYEKSEDLT